MSKRIAEVPRYPIEAKKDPAVPLPKWDADAENWTASLAALSDEAAQTLLSVARCLCPHDWLDESAYRLVVLKISRQMAASAEDAALVGSLVEAVEKGAEGAFGELPLERQCDVLRAVESTEGFRRVHFLTVTFLYDDPVVWSGCGYEGVAGCHEETVRDNTDDLDWVPSAQSLIEGRAG